MTKVIGICGLIGSGKGTAADYLHQQYQFEKVSFADRLKDGVSAMFGWPRDLLEGDTPESREWRETPDPFWTEESKNFPIGKKYGDITPRLVLQLVGTECMRNGLHEDIWTLLVKQQCDQFREKGVSVVIPDTRFSNEIDLIKRLGGEIWWVRRGDLPEWWDTAIYTNQKMKEGYSPWYKNSRSSLTFMPDTYPNVHISEWNWAMPDAEYDQIIENDGSLEDLYDKVAARLNT